MENDRKYNLAYLFHKCTLLYIYLQKDSKRALLQNIQSFIQKISNETNKEEIISLFISYLEKITSGFMIQHLHMEDSKKRLLLNEIEIKCHAYARSTQQHLEEQEDEKEEEKEKDVDTKEKEKEKDVDEKRKPENMDKRVEHLAQITSKITHHIDGKMLQLHDELNRFFEMKFQILQQDVSKSVDQEKMKLHILHKDVSKSVNEEKMKLEMDIHKQMEKQNSYIDFVSQKIKDEIERYQEKYVSDNYGKVRDEIRDKILYDLEGVMKSEISQKVEKLTHILNKNLEISLQNATQHSHDSIEDFVSNKIHEYECLIQNTPYLLKYDKLTHQIHLLHGEKSISSITLPMITGAQGVAGAPGTTPKFKKLDITPDGYLSVIVEDHKGSYELKSSNRIPPGTQPQVQAQPQVQVQKSVETITKSVHDLHFDKAHVMRLDSNYNQTLIILKSLAIGENSRALRPNSIAVGGATCFQENSLAIGNKSQTLAKNNIALYGSTSGENAFAYAAQNVPSNQFVVGSVVEEESKKYNIQKIVLSAEQIQLNSKQIVLSAYDEKIRNLEAKIAALERSISSPSQHKEKDLSSSTFASIFPSTFVQDKFF